MNLERFLKTYCLGIIAVGLALFDNSIKEKIESGTIDNGVIDKTKGFAEIEKHHNKGIPLNKFDKHTKEITALSAGILAGHAMNTGISALTEDDTSADIANTLILAGALSNVYDRVKRGYVVDYLKIGRKRAIYNLSDFMIIGGALVPLFKMIREIFKREN